MKPVLREINDKIVVARVSPGVYKKLQKKKINVSATIRKYLEGLVK